MKVVLTVEQHAKNLWGTSLIRDLMAKPPSQALEIFFSEFVNTFDTEADNTEVYCAFHKHANSKVQKRPIAFFTAVNHNYYQKQRTLKHRTDLNPPITNHRPWPTEGVDVKFCFLRGPLRWLTAVKNTIVSWLLNFRIRTFVKSAVKMTLYDYLCDLNAWVVIFHER